MGFGLAVPGHHRGRPTKGVDKLAGQPRVVDVVARDCSGLMLEGRQDVVVHGRAGAVAVAHRHRNPTAAAGRRQWEG